MRGTRCCVTNVTEIGAPHLQSIPPQTCLQHQQSPRFFPPRHPQFDDHGVPVSRAQQKTVPTEPTAPELPLETSTDWTWLLARSAVGRLSVLGLAHTRRLAVWRLAAPTSRETSRRHHAAGQAINPHAFSQTQRCSRETQSRTESQPTPRAHSRAATFRYVHAIRPEIFTNSW